jgi:hypothetical protein
MPLTVTVHGGNDVLIEDNAATYAAVLETVEKANPGSGREWLVWTPLVPERGEITRKSGPALLKQRVLPDGVRSELEGGPSCSHLPICSPHATPGGPGAPHVPGGPPCTPLTRGPPMYPTHLTLSHLTPQAINLQLEVLLPTFQGQTTQIHVVPLPQSAVLDVDSLLKEGMKGALEELIDNALGATMGLTKTPIMAQLRPGWRPRIWVNFFDDKARPEKAALVVMDNGCGMSEGVLKDFLREAATHRKPRVVPVKRSEGKARAIADPSSLLPRRLYSCMSRIWMRNVRPDPLTSILPPPPQPPTPACATGPGVSRSGWQASHDRLLHRPLSQPLRPGLQLAHGSRQRLQNLHVRGKCSRG